MTGISRRLRGRASWLWLVAVACGGRAATEAPGTAEPTPTRAIPLDEAVVLETTGAPPPDTGVTFRTGERRVIVLRHGPPDDVAFAELEFTPEAFGPDVGREVRVEVRPRPGVYGVDVAASLPFRSGATLSFSYPRYFKAPGRAALVYGNDIVYERALAIGLVQAEGGLLTLLPSTRPALDVIQAQMPGPGGYLVAAPR